MPWVYMLECADGSYYVGSTIDLERRMWEHQEGLGAAYTRRRRPVTLVWSAACERIDEAFAFEKQIQGWSRKKRLALIEERTSDLAWLSSRSYAAKTRRSGGFETLAERAPQPPAKTTRRHQQSGGFETLAERAPQPPDDSPTSR